MPENKRWAERYPVDLKVRFGQEKFSDNGKIQDISMFGFAIETSEIFPKGALLKVQLLTPDKKFIEVHGTVQWASVNGSSGRANNRLQGMGIEIRKFLEGRETYKRLCNEYWKKGTISGVAEKEEKRRGS